MSADRVRLRIVQTDRERTIALSRRLVDLSLEYGEETFVEAQRRCGFRRTEDDGDDAA